MLNVLLAGCAGYVGHAIRQGCPSDDSVSLYSVDIKELDLTRPKEVVDFCANYKITHVINAASVPLVGKHYPIDLIDTNLRIFATLLNLIAGGYRVINFCSGAIYGRSYWDLQLTEAEALSNLPRDAHGLIKYIVEATRRGSKAGFLNIRLFGVYGSKENYLFKFIPNTIVRCLLGLPIQIIENRMMSQLFVEDVPKFLFSRVLKDPIPNLDVNFSGPEIRMSDLAQTIVSMCGGNSEIIIEPGTFRGYSGDVSLLTSLYPGFAFTSLEEGLSRTISYWKSVINDVDVDLLIADNYAKSFRSGSVGEVINT